MPANPYLIAGSLPWGGGGADTFSYLNASDPEKALASHYGQAYRSALDQNQSNYDNILRGFQQTALAQMGSQRAIGRGYKNLLTEVMGRLENTGRSGAQDIMDRYAGERGSEEARLIDAGLGNTTVASSVRRGLTYDEEKSRNRLAETVANLMAGYQSNLGQAGLQFRERALGERTGQANAQLNWMNSLQAQYPDASMYAQIASQLGEAKEAKEARSLMMQMMSRGTGGTISPTKFSDEPSGYINPEMGAAFMNAMGGSMGRGGGMDGQTPGYSVGMPGGGSGGYGPYGVGGSSMSGGFGRLDTSPYGNFGPSFAGSGPGSNPYGAGGSGMGGGFANPGGYTMGPAAAYSPMSMGKNVYGSPTGFGGGFGGSASQGAYNLGIGAFGG
jgi:hypothetical protein